MLLWLCCFPCPWVVLVGLVTVFAGYTAVGALNDIVDCRSDRANFSDQDAPDDSAGSLDAVFIRPPWARILLGCRSCCQRARVSQYFQPGDWRGVGRVEAVHLTEGQ